MSRWSASLDTVAGLVDVMSTLETVAFILPAGSCLSWHLIGCSSFVRVGGPTARQHTSLCTLRPPSHDTFSIGILSISR